MPKGASVKTTAADLAASFQAAVRDVLVEKSRRALLLYLDDHPGNQHLPSQVAWRQIAPFAVD